MFLRPSDPDPLQHAHYRIRQRPDGSPWVLGVGGMGLTYRAEDERLRVDVALKVIHPSRISDPDSHRLLVREARAAARIAHPNVAPVVYLHDEPGRMFYAMELVEGISLQTWLRQHGRPSPAQALGFAEQIAAGLGAIHQQHLIHRDLKPPNLMVVEFPPTHPRARSLTASGGCLLKIIDFGLARAIRHGTTTNASVDDAAPTLGFRGTAAYASPEQCQEAEDLDGRTDLYSLGCILWEMLAGRPPFVGRNLREILNQHTNDEPPWSDLAALPAAVLEPLRGLLAKSPADRYPDAVSAAEALAAARVTAAGLECPIVPALPPLTTLTATPRAASASRRSRRGGPVWIALVGAAIVAIGLGAGWWLRAPRSAPAPTDAAASTEKSIAVLPFRNLSDARENSFFAEGMQDDILTRLAQIRDLRVIARSSLQAYRAESGAPRDLAAIGAALGVTHLVEGSVRREAGRVVISVAVVEVRGQRQIWAGRFDRALADVFAVQDEIAGQIAEQIQARLGTGERAAMASRPTENLAAYDLYLQAKELLAAWQQMPDPNAVLLQAARLLNEATAQDPKFTLAFCLLSEVHVSLYWNGSDRTPARLALCTAALEAAERLQPQRGEVRLARGLFLYWGRRDFAAARVEFAAATNVLPNSEAAFRWLGLIDRRLGRWDDAITHLDRALALDPRSPSAVRSLHLTYRFQRRWDEALRVLDRAAASGLVLETLTLDRAEIPLLRDADPAPLVQARAQLARTYDPNSLITLGRILAALHARDPVAAAARLSESADAEFTDPNLFAFPRSWFEGWIARLRGDSDAAAQAFRTAREVTLAALRQAPEAPKRLAVLAQLDALLGQRDAALAGAQRSVDLVPLGRDAIDGPELLEMQARTSALAGENAAALDLIERLLAIPGDLCYGSLRLDPVWDGLRAEPRFLAALAGQQTGGSSRGK